MVIQKSGEVRDSEYDLKPYLRCSLEQANKWQWTKCIVFCLSVIDMSHTVNNCRYLLSPRMS